MRLLAVPGCRRAPDLTGRGRHPQRCIVVDGTLPTRSPLAVCTGRLQPKICPTWVGGTEKFPVPPFSRQVQWDGIPPGPSHRDLFGARWDRFSCGAFKFMTPWHLFYELTSYPVGPIVRKGPHTSKFCTTARRALPALSGAHLAAFGCCRGLLSELQVES